jgi:hypothetical protein
MKSSLTKSSPYFTKKSLRVLKISVKDRLSLQEGKNAHFQVGILLNLFDFLFLQVKVRLKIQLRQLNLAFDHFFRYLGFRLRNPYFL